MNDLFEKVLETYIDGEKRDNKDKEYHKIICYDIPNYIEDILDDNTYVIKGSCGASNKADVPWIGVFNKNITVTAQKGIYIVYLFKADMSGFYLCLGQGVTNFEKYKENKNEYMSKVTEYFKNMTQTVSFSKEGIDLMSRTEKGKGYAKVNVLSKYYSKDKLDQYNLKEDLTEMVKIYEQIYNDMNQLPYDEVIENIIGNAYGESVKVQNAIELINNVLEDDEKIQERKHELKEIEVPKVKKRIYKTISERKISKIDYIKKTKKDAKTGLSGEELVLAYEKDKMIKRNRSDLVEKIDWVSTYDDSRGYDILSFDFDESGKEYKIYIEVKTTTEGEKNSFFVTVNELKKMNKEKEKYWIYRIGKVNKEPVFYKVNGKDFLKTFNIEPMVYSANINAD